jgi:DNA replication protein DnaC
VNNPKRVSQYLEAIGFQPRITNHQELCAAIEPWLENESKRGLLLFGKPGTGKTYFCQRLLGGLRTIPISRLIKSLADSDDGARDIELFGNMAIDDLGTEDKPYGRDLCPLLIDIRWRAFENGASTFLTTNLTPAQLKQRYDARVLSRILGMCDTFTTDGDDQRISTAGPYAAPGGEGRNGN